MSDVSPHHTHLPSQVSQELNCRMNCRFYSFVCFHVFVCCFSCFNEYKTACYSRSDSSVSPNDKQAPTQLTFDSSSKNLLTSTGNCASAQTACRLVSAQNAPSSQFFGFFFVFPVIISPLLFVFSPGDAGVAEEERPVHRGGVSERVQQQEHEGHPGAAQQRRGGGPGRSAGCSARRAAQSMFPHVLHISATATALATPFN